MVVSWLVWNLALHVSLLYLSLLNIMYNVFIYGYGGVFMNVVNIFK